MTASQSARTGPDELLTILGREGRRGDEEERGEGELEEDGERAEAWGGDIEERGKTRKIEKGRREKRKGDRSQPIIMY